MMLYFCQFTLDKSVFLWYYLGTNYGLIVIMKAYLYPETELKEYAVSEKNIVRLVNRASVSGKFTKCVLVELKSGKILAVSKDNKLIKKLNPTETGYVNSVTKMIVTI
jgi:hypothetical protein